MAGTEIPKPKLYRLYQIENVAERILKDTDEYFTGYRFDIESFITGKHGLIIDVHYHLKANHDTWAYMLINSNRIFVDNQLIDNDRLEKKFRFTIGEEFAHYLIHRDVFAGCSTLEKRNRRYFSFSEIERKYIENNARALAAALLMPKGMVEDRVSQMLNGIETYSENIIDTLAQQIAHDFDVNFTAARSRLKMLGYHNRLKPDID